MLQVFCTFEGAFGPTCIHMCSDKFRCVRSLAISWVACGYQLGSLCPSAGSLESISWVACGRLLGRLWPSVGSLEMAIDPKSGW